MNHLEDWALIALKQWPTHYVSQHKRSYIEEYKAKMRIVYQHYHDGGTLENRP